MSDRIDANQICKLINGQIYSIEDRFWLNIQESKILKKKLRKGYVYRSYGMFIDELSEHEKELITKRRQNYLRSKGLVIEHNTYDECYDECCDCSDEEYPGSPE